MEMMVVFVWSMVAVLVQIQGDVQRTFFSPVGGRPSSGDAIHNQEYPLLSLYTVGRPIKI